MIVNYYYHGKMTQNLPVKHIADNIYHLVLEEFSDGFAVYNDVLHHAIQSLEIPQYSTLIIEPKHGENLCQLQNKFTNYFSYIAYILSSEGEKFDLQFSHAITIKNAHANTFLFDSFDSAFEQCNNLPV